VCDQLSPDPADGITQAGHELAAKRLQRGCKPAANGLQKSEARKRDQNCRGDIFPCGPVWGQSGGMNLAGRFEEEKQVRSSRCLVPKVCLDGAL
jgi:hypothetical protein